MPRADIQFQKLPEWTSTPSRSFDPCRSHLQYCCSEPVQLFLKKLNRLFSTDNGPEFNHVSAIKQSLDGKQESILFFCEPYHSSEKPRVEKNHTLTRHIWQDYLCECQRKSEPSANQYLSHLCERILEPPTPKVTANT